MKAVIVGRTNTGKSSLFNRITRSRKALVFDEQGITRDILRERVSWWNRSFEILDSGGWTPESSKGELAKEIHKKFLEVLSEGDVFILVVDGKEGLHPQDSKVLECVRKTGKPFLTFVNKVDSPLKENLLTADFYSLSSNLLSGSCEQDLGIGEVIDWILQQLSPRTLSAKEDTAPSLLEIFVSGKANSGKSLLCNRILGESRMIVSSRAGTTLDTVKSVFTQGKQSFALLDNPGSRRGRREERERLSYSKSQSQMEKAHMVLAVMDSEVGPSRQDARLIRLCLEKRKPVIAVANKWDLLKSSEERKAFREEFKKIFHFCPDLPLVTVSAKTGYKKDRLFEVIDDLKEKMHRRIPTPKLNSFLNNTIKKAPAPVYGTSDVKFYYITQNSKVPPGFIAFANYPKGVTSSYKRFILSRLKEHFGLKGIPLSLQILPRK